MKKYIFAIIIAVAMTAVAAEKLVASWDFEKGLDSGDIKMSKRGSAALVDEEGHGKVLKPAATYDGKPAGLILRGNAKPETLPEAFVWAMDIKYQAPETLPKNGLNTYLLDCKYSAKNGLSWLMTTDKAGNPQLRAVLGTSEGGVAIIAKAPALKDGQWHSIKLVCQAPKMEMFVDGKTAGMSLVKGKPMPPAHRLTIGDRVGSSYGPFRGLIDNVTLSAIVPDEAEEAK